MYPTLMESGLKLVKPFREIRTAFNPFRMERVNCSDIVNSMRVQSANKKIPNTIDPSVTTTLIREIKGHNDVITSLKPIKLKDF